MAFVPDAGEPSVSVEEHLARVLAALEPMPASEQSLLESLGLPVCAEVRSPVDLPGFDNSAMDGYAVSHEDVAGASQDAPVQLPVAGVSAAGRTTLYAMSPGTAVKIMTGAPVPRGATAVVPVEWTDAGSSTVTVFRAPNPGQHVRPQGDDIKDGELLLEEGALLGPRQVGLCAAVGLAQVPTRPRPRVVVMSTGAELREPGSALSHDAIYDANSYLLASAVRQAGAIAYRVGITSDDPADFADTLSDQLVRADLVVTSGGVSRGEFDVVKEVLGERGTVWFGQVRMQPGKPQGFGTVGEDATPIFTLPGNPVSAYVSFQLFVLPALRKLMGRTPYERLPSRARLTEPVRSPAGKRQYLRAVHGFDATGAQVTPVGGHGSHLLGDLAVANALAVVPEDVEALPAGASVDVLLLDRDY